MWRRCGSLYPTVFQLAYNMSARTNGTRILAIGPSSTALNSLNGWLDVARISRSLVTVVTDNATLQATSFSDYRVVYVPSSAFQTPGGLSDLMSNATMLKRLELATYVNTLGGSLIVLTQDGQSNPYGFFPSPLTYSRTDFINVTASVNMPQISPPSDSSNLDHNAWHGFFTGPTNYAGVFQVLVRRREGDAGTSCATPWEGPAGRSAPPLGRSQPANTPLHRRRCSRPTRTTATWPWARAAP